MKTYLKAVQAGLITVKEAMEVLGKEMAAQKRLKGIESQRLAEECQKEIDAILDLDQSVPESDADLDEIWEMSHRKG